MRMTIGNEDTVVYTAPYHIHPVIYNVVVASKSIHQTVIVFKFGLLIFSLRQIFEKGGNRTL